MNTAINDARTIAIETTDTVLPGSYRVHRAGASTFQPGMQWTGAPAQAVSLGSDDAVALADGSASSARWLVSGAVDVIPNLGWELSISPPATNDFGFVAMTVSGAPTSSRQVVRVFDTLMRTSTIVERTVGESFVSPWSWIGPVSFNNQRQVAAVFKAGGFGQFEASRPDEIRVVGYTGSSVTIARDVDADAASPFASFLPSVWLTHSGAVAFLADLVGGGRGVYLGDGVRTTTIAVAGLTPGVSDITLVRPSANNYGLVTFLGRDSGGLECVFVGDGTQLRIVARTGDLTPSGPGMPNGVQRLGAPGGAGLTFLGSAAINALGDVAFAARTTAADGLSLAGASAYFAVSCRGDVNGDGVVSVQDIFDFLSMWFGAQRGGDANRDGVFSPQDMFVFMQLWFSGC